MDFITNLPPSKRGDSVYNAILVIVDRFTKMSIYIPTTKQCTSLELAQLLSDEVVRHYGVPRGIVSDRDSVFTSQFWTDFCFEAHVKRKLSTTFHPQSDGQTERQNRILEQYLRCYCSSEQNDWAANLNHAEFAANNSVHPTLRMSPFCVLYGFNPEIHPFETRTRDGSDGRKVPAAAESARRMRQAVATLSQRWTGASKQQSKYYNKKYQQRTYCVSDQVLVSTKNLKLPVLKKKMGPRFLVPSRILDAIGAQAYRLALPTSFRIHNVFHVSLLEPWQGRAGEEHAESMPLEEHDNEYEVEQFLETQVKARKRYCLVKWKDWPEEYNSWEPEENCQNAARLLSAFWARARSGQKCGKSTAELLGVQASCPTHITTFKFTREVSRRVRRRSIAVQPSGAHARSMWVSYKTPIRCMRSSRS